MTNPVQIGDCTLYLGDCRKIMEGLEPVDCLITDPPYGVAGKRGSGLRKQRKEKTEYLSYDDTAENFFSCVIPAVNAGITLSTRAAITSGFTRMYDYPRPKHVGTFQYPSSCSMSPWGIALWQPILYYGKDPHQGRLKPDSKTNCNDSDKETNHPCPKPIKQWDWLVNRASKEDDVVLDIFMGSGTTGVSCANLKRKFIGIELEPKYFDIACERIQKAYDQPDLFVEPPAKPVQETLEIE